MEAHVDTGRGAKQEDLESVGEQRGEEDPERPEVAPPFGVMAADSSFSRARLLFMQMREQVRSQAAKDCGKKTGLVDMVQMAAHEMKNRAVEAGGLSPGKEQRGAQDWEAGGEEVPDRQEMLADLEMLRREFKHELDLLRAEMQDYIDKVTQSLESRLLSQRLSFQRQVLLGPGTLERPLRAGDQSLEGRHKSLSVPSLLPGKGPNRAATTTRPKARRTKSETFSPTGEGLSENVMAVRSGRVRKVVGTLPPPCPTLSHSRALPRGTAKPENPGRVKQKAGAGPSR